MALSMMAIEGDKARPDGTFEMFNPGRKSQWAEGWTVTHKRGSDGEPMLVGAVPVAPPGVKKK